MRNLKEYPSKYEIKEILQNISNKSFINEFAQERGLFLKNSSYEELADELSLLFFEMSDLETIRMQAFQESHKNTLSGFIVKSSDKGFNLKNSYDSLIHSRQRPPHIIMSNLVEIQNKEDCYKGSIEYDSNKPGRIEFLQNETSSFDFYFYPKGDGEWQVEIDCSKSKDSKEFLKLLKKGIDKDTEAFILMEQDKLKTADTISFFDTLARNGLDKSWKFEDVKQLTFRRSNEDETEDDIEENTKEADSEQLRGISHAILEGQNLRENPFVVQSEKGGYRFTAMTYEFSNKLQAEKIQIKAEFKGRPKVFEVAIEHFEIQKLNASVVFEETKLPLKRNIELRSLFWNNAKKIYDFLMK